MRQAARNPRNLPARVVAASGALACAVFSIPAQAADTDASVSGTKNASALTNPFFTAVSAPQPPAALPVALPPVPKGPQPNTHLYLTSSGGQAATYADAEFQLPSGFQLDTLTVTFDDDSALLENQSAETAALTLCALSEPLETATPDLPVAYDCGSTATGRRAASSTGGSWTFDASPLRASVKAGRFGIAIIPTPASPTEASTVSAVRSSFKVAYTGTVVSTSSPAPSSPVPESTSESPTIAPVPEPALTSEGGTAELPPLVPVGETPAGQGPLVAQSPATSTTGVTGDLVQAGSSTTTGDTEWRSLLLLLVPGIPFIGLGLYRRLNEGAADGRELAEQYPGLASLTGPATPGAQTPTV